MVSRPMEAVSPIPSPIHRRDTLDPDYHRVRDEIELRYPSTYHYIKDAFCHVKRCKFNGECGRCPADELRRYAARDTDRIGELMRAIKERDDNIAFLRGRVQGLEKRIEEYRASIIELRREKGFQLPF